MKLNLTMRFLVPTLAVIVFGMSVAAYLSLQQSEDAVRSAMTQQSEQLANGLQKQMSAWLVDIQKDLHSMSRNILLQKLERDSGYTVNEVKEANSWLAKTANEYG